MFKHIYRTELFVMSMIVFMFALLTNGYSNPQWQFDENEYRACIEKEWQNPYDADGINCRLV